MYLKSIEIQGFKSFAKKTKITFNEAITAVVGPNGSGKSNILDAISWALGEQKVKSLRGSKMSDVIFSGTDMRKALGLAQVTMTFDNSKGWLDLPYEEVSVQRKMYRSGESEFRINKEVCRLKDIQELFMDTGVGKDGYSFIGQGKIDAVLSDKPEDRRHIFEEAAGISKFKKRKLESMKKLDGVLDDLSRIEDLLSELYQQEEALKLERDRYLAYQKVYEEKKKLDHQDYVLATGKKREKLQGLKESIRQMEEEIKEKRSALAEKKEELSQKDRSLGQVEKTLEEESGAFQEKLEAWLKLEAKQLELKNQLDHFQEALERNSEDRDKLLKETRTLSEEKEENLGKIKEAEESIEETKASLEVRTRDLKEKKQGLKNREEGLDLLAQKLQLADRDRNELTLRIDTQTQMVKEKALRRDKYAELLDQVKREKEQLLKERDLEKEEVRTLEGQKDQAFVKLEKDQASLESLAEDLERQKDLGNRGKLAYDQEKNRLNFLQSTLDHYNGFQKSVKLFLRITDQEGLFQEDLLGPLANLFTVDKEYELAMSLALGFALQNIVVRSDSRVKEMIQLLKKRDLGRITFLPLNRYRAKRSLGPAPNGVLGYARDFIHCEEDLQGLFDSLLGNIVFVEDYDQGLRLSKSLRGKIISLKGDVFHPKGSITGGSVQKGSVQILNQEKRLRDQEDRVKTLEADLEKKRQAYEGTLKAYQDLKRQVEDRQAAIQVYNEDLYKRGQKIYALEQNLDLQLKQISRLEEDLKLAIEDHRTDLDKLKVYEDRKKNQDREEEKQDSYEKEKQALKEAGLALEDEGQKLQEVRLDLARLENRLVFLKEKEEELVKTIRRQEEERKDLAEKKIQLEENLARGKEDLAAWQAAYEEKGIRLDRLKESLAQRRRELQEEKAGLQEAEARYQEEEKALGDQDQKLQRQSFQKEKLELELEHYKDRLLERYGSLNQAYLDLPLEMGERDLRLQLEKRAEELAAFGPMNEKVLTEYREVKDRLDFKVRQKEDLMEAKDELHQVLERLNIQMRQAFMESFEEITAYFNDIFSQLFRGGKADISLGEGPVLEAGIEIKAQPPGKKLQSLSLLSGGERALTAVALIFALLKYRPAPFCILDEIDAALDDANIDRYVDYILGLKDIQFIMITHRKPTMEIADVLYGVTMEEKGISTIVPMKLKNTGQ